MTDKRGSKKAVSLASWWFKAREEEGRGVGILSLDTTQKLKAVKKTPPSYNALNSWLGQLAPWANATHLSNCLWMVIALMERGEVSLTRWLPYVPCRGKQAQSKQRRLSRWLHNSRINVHRLYKPLIQAALASWGEGCLYLSLDTSMYWEEYCLVRLAVVYRGRALPLVWRVLKHSSASVAFQEYRDLLVQGSKRLPAGVKVVLLADRGFVQTEAMQFVTTQLGWHYRIRVKRSTWIWCNGKGWRQLKDIHLNPGEARCFHTIKLHKRQWFGPVHLALACNNVNGEYWAVVSDEPTNLQTFRDYALRFDIEESFRDDQSGGWNLQKSQVRSVTALSRLWFLLAVATLYLTAQGVQVVESGRRRWVDPHWFRGNSYFRIGWEWVKTAFFHRWKLLSHVSFSSVPDPQPAMASRHQHDERSSRLEFTSRTFRFLPD